MCGCSVGEHREREWSLQWLLAGGQYMAQRSPQMYLWRQSHGFWAFGTNSHFFYLQWSLWWQRHRKNQLHFYPWLQRTLWYTVSLRYLISGTPKASSDSLTLNRPRKVCVHWVHPMDLSQGLEKPWPISFSQFVHLSTIQPTALCRRSTNISERLLQWSSNRDWFKTPVLRCAVTRHSSEGETRDTSGKHLLAVPDEINCYRTLRCSMLCCSSTIITPPLAVLLCLSLIRPGAALPAVSDLAWPHNPQESILPDLKGPHCTDHNYKKPACSPPQRKRKAWWEEMLPVVFYIDSFHTSPLLTPSSVNTCRVKTLSSGVEVVTLVSDTANTKSFPWKELPPVQSFAHSVFFLLQAKSARTDYFQFIFFFFFILFYFVCCPSLSSQRCLPGGIHVPCTFYSVCITEHYLHNLSFSTCCLPSG